MYNPKEPAITTTLFFDDSGKSFSFTDEVAIDDIKFGCGHLYVSCSNMFNENVKTRVNVAKKVSHEKLYKLRDAIDEYLRHDPVEIESKGNVERKQEIREKWKKNKKYEDYHVSFSQK